MATAAAKDLVAALDTGPLERPEEALLDLAADLAAAAELDGPPAVHDLGGAGTVNVSGWSARAHSDGSG